MRTRPELTRPDAQLYFINFSTARRGGVRAVCMVGLLAAGGGSAAQTVSPSAADVLPASVLCVSAVGTCVVPKDCQRNG